MCMKWCTKLMSHLGGGHIFSFGLDFFSWWVEDIIAINNYAYIRMNFHDVPNLILLEDDEWDNLGKNNKNIFGIFKILNVFVFL